MSLLLNGGFELGNDGSWIIDQDPNSDIVEDSSNAYSGKCYLRTYCTGEWNGTVQTITKNIIPGNDYFFEAAIKSNAIGGSLGNGPGIRIRFYDSSDTALTTEHFYNTMGTTDWVYKSTTITAPANAAKIELYTYCQPGATSGSAWYDHVRVMDLTATMYPTPYNLVLHMPLDDGHHASTIRDLSMMGNHGTPVALDSSSAWATGKVRQSAVFDGSTFRYIQVPYHSSLAPTSEISFGCWAHRDDWTTSTSGTQSIIGKYQSGGYVLLIYNGYVYAMVFVDGTVRYTTALHTGLSSGWHHLFATFTGQVLTLYIDGTPANSYDNGAVGSITYAYDNSLMIGADAYTGDAPNSSQPWLFDGRIDEVRIYDICLSDTEIAVLYNYPGNYACLSTMNKDASWDMLAKDDKDLGWDILGSSEKNLAWKVFNANNQDSIWKIINTIGEEIAWRVLAATDQQTAWKVFNKKEKSITWSIVYLATTYRMLAWMIFNSTKNDVAWKDLVSTYRTLAHRILDHKAQEFAWKILSGGASLRDIGWKIFNDSTHPVDWRLLKGLDGSLDWKIGNISSRNLAWMIQNRGILGQNLSWKILAVENLDLAWKVLNTTNNASGWRVFNISDKQTAWNILGAVNQNTSWTIFNEASQDISWRILMAALPVSLAEFIISNPPPFSIDLASKSIVAFNLNSKSMITFNIK